MKLFKDNAGREWTITINVSAIKRVRDLLKVDLLEIVDGKLLERLIRDPVLLCDVVYAACKPDADKQNITDEEFGRAMVGDAIEMATKALLEEITDFFPCARDRANLRKVLDQTWRVMEKARDLIERRIGDGELDRIAERMLALAGDSSGTAPESPESIPAS